MRHRTLAAVPLLTVAGALVPGPAAGQSVVIPDRVACGTCAIVVGPPTSYGSVSDPLSPDLYSFVLEGGERLYVGSRFATGELLVYDRGGAFRGTLGREGDGPGEFRAIQTGAVGANDSLIVVSDGRITIMDAGGRVARIVAKPASVQAVLPLPGGRLLLHMITRGEGPAHHFHLMDLDGTVVRSFGSVPTSSLGDPYAGYHAVTRASNSTFWAVPLQRYQVQHWTTDGRLTRTLERRADWFPPWTGAVEGEVTRVRPRTRAMAVHQDRQGLLWVASWTADRDWRPLPPDNPGILGDNRAHFDTVLEVLDPRTLQVLARTRTDMAMRGFLPSGAAYALREGAYGEVYVDVFALSLRR